jgi:hypothetical protein
MVRLTNLMLAIVFALAIFAVVLTPLFNEPVFGMSRTQIILIIAGIYVVYALYTYFLDRHYIYLNDDRKKIIFRYYSMRPLSQMKHSIEIPKENFKGYEINFNRMGYLPRIVLIQKMKSGIFKYPAVSLSALSKKELDLLERLLDKYVR